MERQFLFTSLDKFNESLEKFQLNREKVIQNIYQHIKKKQDDLTINKRRVYYSPYFENDKKYILAGFVTVKEKVFLIEATSIWDKEPNDIEIEVHNIGIVRKTK